MPFAPDGLALFSASMMARTLAKRASSVKLALPMPAWMMPVFSVRNSMAPPLASFTAWATLGVTVPTRGFGIVHAGIGKASFTEDALLANVRAIIDALNKAKPSGAKGTYIKKISLSSTMGPGFKVDTTSIGA